MTPFLASLLVAAAFISGAAAILILFSYPADPFPDEAGDYHPTFDPERRD